MQANLRANQNICSVIVDDDHELIPLKLEYVGEMNGGILSLQIHQLFKNDQGDANSPDSEAVLALPKNRSHCITGIECFLNDQKIDIKIEEEKTAKEIAKEGKKQGRTTIRSTSKPDDQQLKIKLGSIKYGSEFKITIRMEILSTNSDSNTYQTIIPFSDQTLDPSAQDNFTFSIVFNEIVPINDISVTCSYERSDFEYTFDGSLLTIDKKPLSTIVILTKLSEKIESLIQNDLHDEYSVISVIPHFLNKPINSDFIFIVDCSGSMSGSRIRNASECLSIFLHSLPVGCNFNVIMFGSSYRSVFGSSLVEYNEANLKRADESVKAMKANLGGTKLLRPLSFAYKQIESVNKKGKVCQIFLLTDGEIHDTETVFKLVNKNRTKSRIFSIGIGKDADRNLVSGLALLSFGKFDFVSESSQITDKVVNLLSLSLAPALTNVAVHASTADGGEIESIEIVPNPMTPIYDGNMATIYVKRDAKEKLIENVLITGKVGDEETEIVVDETINSCELSAKNLFAFNAICDYEKLYEELEEKERKQRRRFSSSDSSDTEEEDDDDEEENQQRKKKKDEKKKDDDNELTKLRDRIVTLSIECGILSKFTSYIGVESEPHRNPLAKKSESSSSNDESNNRIGGVLMASGIGRKMPRSNNMRRIKACRKAAKKDVSESDDSSDEVPKYKKAVKKAALKSDDSSDEELILRRARPKPMPESDDSSDEESKPKKAAKKAVLKSDDSSDEESKPKKAAKKAVLKSDDSSDEELESDNAKNRSSNDKAMGVPHKAVKCSKLKCKKGKKMFKPKASPNYKNDDEDIVLHQIALFETVGCCAKESSTDFIGSSLTKNEAEDKDLLCMEKEKNAEMPAKSVNCEADDEIVESESGRKHRRVGRRIGSNKVSRGSSHSYHLPPPPKEPRMENSVAGIVSSLSFDGRWKSELLEQFLEFAGEKGKLALNGFFESLKLNDDDENKGDIESTIAALCVLHASFSNENSKWKIAEMKAIGWLNSKLQRQWQTEIQQLVSSF